MKDSILIILGIYFNIALSFGQQQGAYSNTENMRSDSIDILNYDIRLDITDFIGRTIKGSEEVTFVAKTTVQHLPLDLLHLNVDSIIEPSSGNHLSFQYNDTLLTISLSNPVLALDTSAVIIYYEGVPKTDPSGWGGWYFSGNYAWNLGVGFQSKPHNYGRAWHPCFDNFKERATYKFTVRTDNGKIATCNGQLKQSVDLGNGVVERTYEMLDAIPSYLANVTVGPYAELAWEAPSSFNPIPISIHAVAADTQNVKAAFVHLNDALQAFETAYGPHGFSHVGYSMVPFNGGAMEHATNITYPISASVDIERESLMAHELAHHWWGDFTTCETPEDMWLNEGFASFSELVFFEHVYGRDRYVVELQDVHASTLSNAHINENRFWPVSGIPHELTYGNHVYNKGALMAHNLRGYLGDTAFYDGVTAYLQQQSFTNMSSLEMRDFLGQHTGVDLSHFFSNWVFNGGWSDFEIDSILVNPIGGSLYRVHAYVEQKLFGADTMHTNVPLTISYFRPDGSSESQEHLISGRNETFYDTLDFQPVLSLLNVESKLVYATTSFHDYVETNEIIQASHHLMRVVPTAGSDSSLLHIDHHYTAPDPVKSITKPYRLSNNHYWEVSGIFVSGFEAEATLFYDARSSNSYLDSDLVAFTEDSLLLLYRSSPKADWDIYPHYQKNTAGSAINGWGTISMSKLLAGQYAFANMDHTVLSTGDRPSLNINVFPNPTSGGVTFKLPESHVADRLVLRTIAGQEVSNLTLGIPNNKVQVDLAHLATGTYIYHLDANESTYTGILYKQP